ncbi:MAG: hypothetical protein LLG45_10065 [Actinomycetia bacterium]|nr:hypothetical protein [Actinomycetes bacterium]
MLGRSAVYRDCRAAWRRLLLRIPEERFRRTVGAVILPLGLYMVYQGAAAPV